MIKYDSGVFRLLTDNTAYIFEVDKYLHLSHVYYGTRIDDADIDALRIKNNITLGSATEYNRDSENYCLDTELLECSGIGKGDYRHSPMELIMPDGSFVCDFVYESHNTRDGSYETPTLPTAYGEAQTLTVTLADTKYPELKLLINFTVYEKSNVIARNCELINGTCGYVYIRKLMSFMHDHPRADFDIITLDGAWAKEAHAHRSPLAHGTHINESVTGDSSNRHNAGFLIARTTASEDVGDVYAYNLIYSGNHYSAVERSSFDTLRVMSGINPHCFLWRLSSSESFVTPQAVMTYSAAGINGASANMHAFINENIVRGEHKSAERPVVLNNWEATFFNFNRRKILALAKRASRLGVEMFVLDDGWFGKRNSDTAGLGDWTVNKKKLPGGIRSLAKRINKMGMRFGLWFEPECVNEDSDLYRAHPDWAIAIPDREPSVGRHQLVLDLTRPEVREYIINSVLALLDSANIEYVKWDYNRHISDMYSSALKNQGEFYHRYILGLYEILDVIFRQKHPEILFESCSSGGNRFDLGMLCYSPQIWTSDDTDPVERLKIQGGIYMLYPQSTVSAHVSMAPHQQTLRDTPLSTRFNVASLGVLGYELDFGELTPAELADIKAQIAFYKAHRRTLQYGRLSRIDTGKANQVSFSIVGDGECIAGLYQTYAPACPGRDTLRVPGLDSDKTYTVLSVEQRLRIKRFGSLIKHITPVPLRADGAILRTVDRYFEMNDGREHYECSGAALGYGINLAMQYSGTGYHTSLRMYGDYGSNLYLIKETENGKTDET